MGQSMSNESWGKLRDKTHRMSMVDVIHAAKSQEMGLPGTVATPVVASSQAVDMQLPTISEGATLQALIAAMASTPYAALLVTNYAGQVVDAVDMFRVVRYILALYEGSVTTQRTTTEATPLGQERYNYWHGYDRWMESRAGSRSGTAALPPATPGVTPPGAMADAAASFFNVTVKEVLAERGLDRYSRTMHPSMAIAETTRVADALHYWAEGYTNVLVKTYDGRFRFVSQTDVLRALMAGDSTMGGAGALGFKKLGITRKVLYSVSRDDRALQAFRLMSDRGIQAVPITDEHGWLAGEISLASLRALRPDNFHMLMGSVGQFYDVVGLKDAPLIVQKDATLSNVLDMMFRDPARRTHLWVASRKGSRRDKERERAAAAGAAGSQRVSSVVSISDVMRAIIMRLHSE